MTSSSDVTKWMRDTAPGFYIFLWYRASLPGRWTTNVRQGTLSPTDLCLTKEKAPTGRSRLNARSSRCSADKTRSRPRRLRWRDERAIIGRAPGRAALNRETTGLRQRAEALFERTPGIGVRCSGVRDGPVRTPHTQHRTPGAKRHEFELGMVVAGRVTRV